jgi:hypothetical protein
MSKTGRRKGRAAASQARPVQPRRTRGRALKLASAVVVLVLAVLAVAGIRAWQSHRAATRAPDPYAIARGRELIGSKRSLESLPYFRRGLEQDPQDRLGHLSYAVALLNAVHQGRTHFGMQQFAVRSSWERVAMVQEALRELAISQKQAEASGDHRTIASAEGTRGQAFADWGLQWEALIAYRHAEWSDSTLGGFTGRADRLVIEMQHPTGPGAP